MNERVGFTQDLNVRNGLNANGERLDNATAVRPPIEEEPGGPKRDLGKITPRPGGTVSRDDEIGALSSAVITAGVPYCTLRFGKYKRPQPFSSSNLEYDLHIALPLPNELQDQTGVDYSEQRLETVGDIINGNINSSAALAAGLRHSGTMVSGAGSGALDAVLSKAGPITKALGGAIGNMAQTLLPAEQITSAIQQSTGLAPNPNPSLMFDGPQLREFTYSWTIMPDNKDQSDNLRKFIANIKSRVLPSVTQGLSPVLFYPHMVQMNFYPWDATPSDYDAGNQGGAGSNPWGWGANTIIRMKKCVVKSFNVNYTPANVPAFFHEFDDQGNRLKPTAPYPVAVTCTIQLKELEYMLANDWEAGRYADGITFGTVLSAGVAALNPTQRAEPEV